MIWKSFLWRRQKKSEPPRCFRGPDELARDLHEALSDRDATDFDIATDLNPREPAAIVEYLDCFRDVVALHVLNARVRNDLSLLPVFFSYYKCALDGETEHFDIRGIDAALAHGAHLLQIRRARSLAELAHAPLLAERLDPFRNIQATFDHVSRALNRTLGLLVEASRQNFDETSYVAENPDVAAAVARGDIKSGFSHFSAHGEKERRNLRIFGDDALPESLVYPVDFLRCAASNTGVGRGADIEFIEPSEFLTRCGDFPMSITVLRREETHDASESFSGRSLGRGLEAFDALSACFSWSTGATYLAAFRDASVDVANGIVLIGEKAWGDSCYATLLCAGGHRRSPEFFSIQGDFARIVRDDKEERLAIGTPVMICCTWASLVNHGHWLMNSLLSVYLVLDELKARRLRLLCPVLSDRQRDEILQLGVPRDAIIETGSRMVRCQRLLYPSPLTTFANTHPSSLCVEFFDFLKGRLPPGADCGLAPRYVFLTRKGFPSARVMLDEERLIDALREYGFECIAPHELSLAEQAHALSCAEIVIGQFGAALWNTPFMPSRATLVEISTSNYVSNEYLYISQLRGHEYIRVMIDPSECDGASAWEGGTFSFRAPIEEVTTIVRGLLSAAAESTRFNPSAR